MHITISKAFTKWICYNKAGKDLFKATSLKAKINLQTVHLPAQPNNYRSELKGPFSASMRNSLGEVYFLFLTEATTKQEKMPI